MSSNRVLPLLVLAVIAAVTVSVVFNAPGPARPLVLLGLAVTFGIGAGLHIRERRRWRHAAAELHMKLEDEGWLASGGRLTGTLAGRSVAVEAYSRGSGKSKARWIKITSLIPRSRDDLTLHLTAEDLGAKVAKVFGGQDVEVGDPAFDRVFRVRSNDADGAQRILDALTREQLLTSARKLEIEVRGGMVTVHRRGGLPAPRTVEEMAAVAARIAQSVESASRWA